METSHLIAQILSLIYVVTGIGMLFNAGRYTKMMSDLLSNDGFLFFGGVSALVTGYLIITFGPNAWTPNFEGLITLIGWIALLKGLFLIIQPKAILSVAGFWLQYLQMGGGVVLVLGLLLGYYGFAM